MGGFGEATAFIMRGHSKPRAAARRACYTGYRQCEMMHAGHPIESPHDLKWRGRDKAGGLGPFAGKTELPSIRATGSSAALRLEADV